MRIYFWTPKPIEERRRWTEIRRALNDRGIMIVSNHDKHIRQTIEKFRGKRPDNQHFLSLFHGIVVDVSSNHEDVGYLIAHATIAKLPALAMHGRSTEQQILNFLRPEIRAQYIVDYNESTDDLERACAEFVKRMDKQLARPVKPTIKFTVRITDELSDYLEWKAARENTKKAEYMRDILYELMNQDNEYRQYRRLNKGPSK